MEGLQTFTFLLSCDKQTKKVGISHSCQTMMADTGQNNKIINLEISFSFALNTYKHNPAIINKLTDK